MTDRQREETRAYSISVTFRSGSEPFASETFHVHAADEFDAERCGRDRAARSAFHNAQVPDLGITVEVAPIDPDEPDDDPPVPMAQPPNTPRRVGSPGI